jgi:hypothetical protein
MGREKLGSCGVLMLMYYNRSFLYALTQATLSHAAATKSSSPTGPALPMQSR